VTGFTIPRASVARTSFAHRQQGSIEAASRRWGCRIDARIGSPGVIRPADWSWALSPDREKNELHDFDLQLQIPDPRSPINFDLTSLFIAGKATWRSESGIVAIPNTLGAQNSRQQCAIPRTPEALRRAFRLQRIHLPRFHSKEFSRHNVSRLLK
jgi:hypothetical protein